jgi:hypothetical protein
MLACWLTVAALPVACGYRFSGSGPLAGNVRRVYVPMLENRTRETGLEAMVTSALRYEIVRSGNRLAEGPEAADGVLSGQVVEAASQTIARQTTAVATERRVHLTAVLELREVHTDRPLWARRAVQASETYVVSSDRLSTDQNRRRALERAARRLAQKVLASVADDF